MPLDRDSAVNHLAGALRRVGFIRRKRTKSGSQYLALPGYPFQIRISDHRWSGWSAQRQCQVVCQEIVADNIEQKELDARAVLLKDKYLARIRQRQNLPPLP